MNPSCCGGPAPKEKKFGVKVCRERKCIDLQIDPKYPTSPQMCAVTHGMPGSMSCCVKEMPDEQFIRHISGQLNNSPYTAPNPGVKNCPATCPYKIITVEEKLTDTLAEGKKNTKSVKVGKCALDGMTLGGYSGCPCNVLGNPNQEEQIAKLNDATAFHRALEGHFSVNLCRDGNCPDGKDRCNGNPGTDCPLIRMPFKEIKVCPLWRIPAKLLPAPTSKPEQEPDERLARGKAIREEVLENRETMKRMSNGKSSLKEKPEKTAKKKGDKILEHKPEGKYLYTIHISHWKDTPGEYVLKCMKHKGEPHGVICMSATGAEVNETVPDYLTFWAGMDSPPPDPYNKPDGNLQYEDETGLFPAYLFFNNDGTTKKTTPKKKPATPEKTTKPVEEKQAASKKKKKEQARSIVDRIDDLEHQTEMYLWADITHCCVLIQEIKCLFRRLRKSQVKMIHCKAAPRIKINQSDLFSFGKEAPEPVCTPYQEPVSPPQEIHCGTVKIRKCCPTCAHHKIKKTFEKTCPRLPDLLFEGGHLSAIQLMLETSLKDCEHWALKPEKPKAESEKKEKKKSEKRYTKGQTASCIGCRYDNCGPDRVVGSACLHPNFGTTEFLKTPTRGGCYTKKKEENS